MNSGGMHEIGGIDSSITLPINSFFIFASYIPIYSSHESDSRCINNRLVGGFYCEASIVNYLVVACHIGFQRHSIESEGEVEASAIKITAGRYVAISNLYYIHT